MSDDDIIYESPDHGKTFYARIAGTNKRVEVCKTLSVEEVKKEISENELWNKIRRAAETNTSLKLALERAKMIYYLGGDHGS